MAILVQHYKELSLWQVYGRRANWEDPADWVIESYPWPHTNDQDWPSLLRLRPEDVGYDAQGTSTTSAKTQGQGTQQSETEGDPLVSALSFQTTSECFCSIVKTFYLNVSHKLSPIKNRDNALCNPT